MNEVSMATGIRKPGEFCWINMLTPQSAEAREFFGKMLGWTYVELPGMGHLLQVSGHRIGGLFDLAHPNTPHGTPAYIGVMAKVDSADSIAEKVTSLGGTSKPAFDIMDQGRMAVCFDPNGAEFDVWEPKKGPGTDVDSSLHGAPSWFETLTTDAGRATTFYSGLFGWTPETMRSAGTNYTVFKQGNVPVAGMLQITPHMPKMPSHWATYFTVNDVEETVREAVKLGAKVCMTMKEAEGVGRFSGLTSPQGVVFYVITYTRS
jgi:predicted enzyme related to lactoylglutathione lyase